MRKYAISIAINLGYTYGSSQLSREDGRFEREVERLNSVKHRLSDEEYIAIMDELVIIDRNRPD